MPTRMFHIDQVARLLGATPSDVKVWMRRGWMPFVRFPDGATRISEQGLLKFLRGRGIDITSLAEDIQISGDPKDAPPEPAPEERAERPREVPPLPAARQEEPPADVARAEAPEAAPEAREPAPPVEGQAGPPPGASDEPEPDRADQTVEDEDGADNDAHAEAPAPPPAPAAPKPPDELAPAPTGPAADDPDPEGADEYEDDTEPDVEEPRESGQTVSPPESSPPVEPAGTDEEPESPEMDRPGEAEADGSSPAPEPPADEEPAPLPVNRTEAESDEDERPALEPQARPGEAPEPLPSEPPRPALSPGPAPTADRAASDAPDRTPRPAEPAEVRLSLAAAVTAAMKAHPGPTTQPPAPPKVTQRAKPTEAVEPPARPAEPPAEARPTEAPARAERPHQPPHAASAPPEPAPARARTARALHPSVAKLALQVQPEPPAPSPAPGEAAKTAAEPQVPHQPQPAPPAPSQEEAPPAKAPAPAKPAPPPAEQAPPPAKQARTTAEAPAEPQAAPAPDPREAVGQPAEVEHEDRPESQEARILLGPRPVPSLRARAKQIADAILDRAEALAASDVYLHPGPFGLSLRLRIQGVVREQESFRRLLPPELAPAIVERFRLLAGADETSQPVLTGRAVCRLAGRDIRLDITSWPTAHGLAVSVALADTDRPGETLAGLGLSDEDREALAHLLAQPHGLIVVAGEPPMRTRQVLRALLGEIARPDRHVATVVRALEAEIPHALQTCIDPAAGLSFARATALLAAQRPDGLMVEEVRDLATAQAALDAAEEGALVLAGVRAASAPAAARQLLEFGCEGWPLSTALLACVSHASARLLCEHCKRPAAPQRHVLDALGLYYGDVEFEAFEAAGCEECADTGFAGLAGLFSVLPVKGAVAKALREGGELDVFQQAARHVGAPDLLDAGLDLARRGLCSLAELARVVPGPAWPRTLVPDKPPAPADREPGRPDTTVTNLPGDERLSPANLRELYLDLTTRPRKRKP